MTYHIEITATAERDLKNLRAYDKSAVLDAIELHLSHQPTAESKSRIRKLLQPAISTYRLRVGDFRVYYNVDDAAVEVLVVRVFEKGKHTTPEVGES